MLHLLGVAGCVISLHLGRVQHAYYRSARDRLMKVAHEAGITDLAVATTPGMGAGRRRPGLRVNTSVALVLVLIATAHLVVIVTTTLERLEVV